MAGYLGGLTDMKNQTIMCFLLFILTALTYGDSDQNLITPKISSRLSHIISKPFKVYPINFKENEKILKGIDQWIGKRYDLKRAKKVSKGNDNKYKIFRKLVGSKFQKVDHLILYEKQMSNRMVWEEVKILSKKKLPNDELTEICSNLIRKNDLIQEGNIDRIMGAAVYSRTRKSADSKNSDKFILKQRVILNRSIDKMRVINSKVIIDIVPKTKEVVAFKSFDWAPIHEERGKLYGYMTADEVQDEINKTIRSHPSECYIKNIEPYYFQTKKFLIPVIKILLDSHKSDKPTPIISNYYVFLTKDKSIIDKPLPKKLRKPKTYKKNEK